MDTIKNRYMNPINNIPVNAIRKPKKPKVLIKFNINKKPIVSTHKTRNVNANINNTSVKLFSNTYLIFSHISVHLSNNNF